MKLLLELLDLQPLHENMGNLTKLGLGRMINAFRQSYQYERPSRTRSGGLTTYPIGKEIRNSSVSVGPNSQTVDLGIVKSWKMIKDAYIKRDDNGVTGGIQALIFYVGPRAIALMVGDDLFHNKYHSVGFSWDVKGVASANEAARLVTSLELNKPPSRGEDHDREDFRSEHRQKRTESDWRKDDSDPSKVTTVYTHFQGIAQRAPQMEKWVTTAMEIFRSRLTVTAILRDQDAIKKRGDRMRNPPNFNNKRSDPKGKGYGYGHGSRYEFRLFADSLRDRFLKYKNSKVENISDANDLVKKLLSGGGDLHKITFKGKTYMAIPEHTYIGTNQKRKEYDGPNKGRLEGTKSFYDKRLSELFKGKLMRIDYEGSGHYNRLHLSIQLRDGMIQPVALEYTLEDGYKTEKIEF